jgi:hypothetical protein
MTGSRQQGVAAARKADAHVQVRLRRCMHPTHQTPHLCIAGLFKLYGAAEVELHPQADGLLGQAQCNRATLRGGRQQERRGAARSGTVRSAECP